MAVAHKTIVCGQFVSFSLDDATIRGATTSHDVTFFLFVELISEVISEACAKCTPMQKQHVRKTFKALQNKPELLKEFHEKYDPKGEYRQAFTAFLMASD